MATKFDDLKSLRIEDEHRGEDPQGNASKWSKRYILAGIAVLVVASIGTLVYRAAQGAVPEVETARATADSSGGGGDVVLNATGYIVAHHKIDVNSKVTGRVKWIGVEKGDKVKEGQVLVQLEDDEFRANYLQAKGAYEAANARYEEMKNGSRPEEIQRAQHDLDQAKAQLVDDKANLDRIRPLVQQGVFSRQQLDDAVSRYQTSQEKVNSLQRTFDLAKIGQRHEEIDMARGQMVQAEGQMDYAKSQLDATQIRAPVSGTILDRTAEKGELILAQFASTAGSVVSLADLNDLQVELDISQDDFSKLGPKQKAILYTDAFPDKKYNGEIAQISPEANRQKATVQVKVQVLNPDSFLRPDMNATVQFKPSDLDSRDVNSKDKLAQQAVTGVLVPSAAVKDANGKKVVFIDYQDHAVAREVQVISTRAKGVMVTGLTGGEDVIVNAPAGLKDGEKVRLKGSDSSKGGE
jgi:HlyD family secretion protein